MDLFDRYLHAVRTSLPRAQRDDIIRELSEDLHAQAADREEALGHPLTAADHEAILRQFGHPMLLASRYRPQRHLIGAALMPFYVFALKVAFGIVVAVHVVSAAAMLLAGRPPADIITSFVKLPIGAGLTVFGWVTLAFALIDLNVKQFRFVIDWDPRTLPPVRPATLSRAALISEIVFTTAFILWWAAIPRYPSLLFGPASSLIAVGAAWQTYYLPVLLVSTVALVVKWINVVRPDWLSLRSLALIGTNVASLILLRFLLREDDLIVGVAGSGGDAIAAIVNPLIFISMAIAGVVTAIETAVEVFRLMRRWLGPASVVVRQG